MCEASPDTLGAPRPSPEHRFGYASGIAPTLWMLVAIASVELLVTHLLLSHWSRAAALVLSTLTFAGVAWLVIEIRGFVRRPVVIGNGRLLLRTGRIKAISLSWEQVAAVRRDWSGGEARSRSTLNLALVAYPNVMVDLVTPVRWRGREVRAVAHRLDDPQAFEAALEAVRARA